MIRSGISLAGFPVTSSLAAARLYTAQHVQEDAKHLCRRKPHERRDPRSTASSSIQQKAGRPNNNETLWVLCLALGGLRRQRSDIDA